MKVILLNGSPNKNGSTAAMLEVLKKELAKSNIEGEILHVGTGSTCGCSGCGTCGEKGDGRCVIEDDVNVFLEKMEAADGLIVGSPVHYAGIAGNLKCFLDRAFFAGNCFRRKPAAAVVAARRAGATTTLDQIYKYFAISEMVIATSSYWNMVYGLTPEHTAQDQEGQEIIAKLGENFAWLLEKLS